MTSAETQAPQAAAVVWKFPLTVAGTTFAFGVAASASAPGAQEGRRCPSPPSPTRRSPASRCTWPVTSSGASRCAVRCFDRLAGILLTAIAVILLANGFTNLVLNRLHR